MVAPISQNSLKHAMPKQSKKEKLFNATTAKIKVRGNQQFDDINQNNIRISNNLGRQNIKKKSIFFINRP